MIKKTSYIIIMLAVVCCLFAGCKKETNRMENNDTKIDSAENNNDGVRVQDEETTSLIGKANKQGNSIGNLNEYGLIARQGEWIYYNDSGDLKKKTVNGSEYEYLGECNAYYINVVGEWIYYSDWKINTLSKKKIDGSETVILSDKFVDYVYVEDEWIYYKAHEDDISVLYRMRLDGSDNERIFDEAYCVYQGRIYYVQETLNSEYQLCSVSMNGEDNTVLVDGRISYLNVDDGWIYYRGDDEGNYLYKMKIDGTEKTRLSNTSAANIIVWDEWIYYIPYDVDDVIYRMKKDGTNIQYANNIPKVEDFNVVEGKISYTHLENNRKYFYSFEEACFLELKVE